MDQDIFFELVVEGYSSAVQDLLYQGENVFNKNGDGESALLVAAKSNHIVTALTMLNYIKCEIKLEPDYEIYYDFLEKIIRNVDVDKYANLFEYKFGNQIEEAPFLFAIVLNRSNYVSEFLLKNPQYLVETDIRGRNVLHWAVHHQTWKSLIFF